MSCLTPPQEFPRKRSQIVATWLRKALTETQRLELRRLSIEDPSMLNWTFTPLQPALSAGILRECFEVGPYGWAKGAG